MKILWIRKVYVSNAIIPVNIYIIGKVPLPRHSSNANRFQITLQTHLKGYTTDAIKPWMLIEKLLKRASEWYGGGKDIHAKKEPSQISTYQRHYLGTTFFCPLEDLCHCVSVVHLLIWFVPIIFKDNVRILNDSLGVTNWLPLPLLLSLFSEALNRYEIAHNT